MQKQKLKKALAFVLGLGILFVSGEISADRLSATITQADEEIKIDEIENFSSRFSTQKVGDVIFVYGEGFGTDIDKLKINLAGEDYSISRSYGSELQFELINGMQSGNLFVKKEIEAGEVISNIESNKIYFNFYEPAITKIDATAGLLPENELKISGKNLDTAEFWCGDEKLTVKDQQLFSATLILPAKFTECSLIAKKDGFEVDTKETLTITSPATVSGIKSLAKNFYVYGKGFANFEDSLSQFSLIFDSGSTLTNPEFVTDGELLFSKGSTLLPRTGMVALKTSGILSPQFEYSTTSSFPSISEISNLRERFDGKAIFQLDLDGSIGDRAKIKIMLNNQEVELTGTEIELTSEPPQSGTAWTEFDGWKSEIFEYEFTENLKPKITEFEVDSSDQRMNIIGRNFGSSKSDFDISSTIDFSITDFGPNEIKVTLPFEKKEGSFSLSVSNKWGSSNSVSFTLPANAGKSFLPQPKITGLEFTEGISPGKQVQIFGENFLDLISANFGGVETTVKILDMGKVEAVIPASSPLIGKISVENKNREESTEFDYQLLAESKLKPIAIEFPVTEITAELEQNDDWQNLFSFTMENTQKPIIIDLIEFSFDENNLPFADFQLVDADGEEITGAKIEISQKNKNIIFSKIEVPVAMEEIIFTLQTKVFRQLEEDKNFNFELVNLIVHDSDNIARRTEIKTISITAADLTAKLCREISGREWQDCRKRVRRPVRRPSADTSR